MPVTAADKRTTFARCMRRAVSCCPTPGMSAARERCSTWASRRSLRPARALPGRSGGPTIVSPSRTCCSISPRCAARSTCPSMPISRAALPHEAEKVAAHVARAVRTGVAGLSIEDSTGDAAKPLYERALAIERIKAARAAIDADSSGVLLTGRCEGFLVGQDRSEHGDRPAARPMRRRARIACMRRASRPKNRSPRS